MELQEIRNCIYEIRGVQVMLDRDLAKMYGVETKRLNESVRRNIDRFPEDFMFELTAEECNLLADSLRSQIATSKRGGNRYSTFAFTEDGVAMLSSVLRSKVAINDLSEDTRKELDDIYMALAQMADKLKDRANNTERKKIGYKK